MRMNIKVELTVDEAAAISLLLTGNPLATVFREHYPEAARKIEIAGKLAAREIIDGEAVH